MHIRNEQVAIKMQSNSYLYLMLYRIDTHKGKFFHVKLDIYQKIKGDYRKIDTYIPQLLFCPVPFKIEIAKRH